MDFKSDRIMDYMVYHFVEDARTFQQYMLIPLTVAEYNITDCMPWMVFL